MPPRCTCCDHPRRADLDADLLAGRALSYVARTYAVSPSAAHRHKRRHLSGPVAAAMRAREEASASYYSSLAAKVEEAQRLARQEYDAASPGSRVRLDALDRVLKSIQLEIQHTRPAGGHTTINIIELPEWRRLRDTILSALARHPDAYRDMRDALDAAAEPLEAPSTLPKDRFLPPRTIEEDDHEAKDS